MSTTPDNPYRPPSSHVADVREPGADLQFAVPAARLDAGRGVSWIGEGWALFKMAPVLWIVALLILFGIQLVLGLIPVLGSIASILVGPIFMVGVLAFAHGLANGEAADLGNLFVGFKEKLGALVTVALLYFVMILAVIVLAVIAVVVLLGGSSLLTAADPEQAMMGMMAGAAGLSLLLVFLVVMALFMLVAAAYWYAPGLVFFAGLGATDAMKQSFSACLANWLPFLVYGLVSFFVLIFGTVALFIGLLVAVPVLMASYYASFRDLFGRAA